MSYSDGVARVTHYLEDKGLTKMLITVYFRIQTTITKAIIDEKFLDFFLNLGAVRDEKEAKDAAKKLARAKRTAIDDKPVAKEPVPTEIKKSEGDVGAGKPGTLKFHEYHLNDMRDFDSITKYVRTITGNIPRKTGKSTIASFRRTALSMIKDFIRNANQSR